MMSGRGRGSWGGGWRRRGSGGGWGRGGRKGGAKPGREYLQPLKTHRSISHPWPAPHYLSHRPCHFSRLYLPRLPHLLLHLRLTPRHLPKGSTNRWATFLSPHPAPNPSPLPTPCPSPRPHLRNRLHRSCLLQSSSGCAGPVGPRSMDRGYPRDYKTTVSIV